MARPRQFDETAALDAAMECFWVRGYEATSVRDLAHCMGVTSTSLYNAFGDKRTLYQRALDRYLDLSFHDRVGRFEHTLPPEQALRAFFNEIVERSLSDDQRRGCLLVNAALEVAPHDQEFRRVIAGVLVEVEDFFRRSVKLGQQTGSISTAHSPENMAQMLLGVLMGIRVLARTRPERTLLEGLVAPIFALLEPAGSGTARRRS